MSKFDRNIWFCTLCVFIFFLSMNGIGSGRGLIMSVLFEFLLLLWYAIKNKPKSYVLMFFLVSFFTFLLGRDCVFLLFPQWCDVFAVESIDYNGQMVKFNCLYLALLAMFIGFFGVKNKFKEVNQEDDEIASWTNDKLRRVALDVFYLSLIFRVLQIITSQTIITGIYADLSNIASAPMLIRILGFVNTVSFILFLCTNPSKGNLKWPLFLFVILTMASVLDGTRGQAVTKLMFIVLYSVSRDYGKEETEKLLTRRVRRSFWIIVPLCLAALNLFAMVRAKNQIESHGVVMDTIGFFVQQGGSSNVITLADENRYRLPPHNEHYILGPLALYRDRFVNRDLSMEQRLTENALYGNNLGAALTYTLDPVYYYQGGGFGTAYLAELYMDFGYVGILIYNILLGMLLRYLSFDVKKRLWMQIFSCFCIIVILFLPRDFALSFVTLLTPSYIGALILVVFLQTMIERQYRRYLMANDIA